MNEIMDTANQWERKSISEVCDVNPRSINDREFEEIEYIDISSVEDGYVVEKKLHSIEEAPSRAKRWVKSGDTVISRVRPGRRQFVYVENPSENTIVSSGFVVLRPKENVDLHPQYLYYATTSPRFIAFLEANATGSAYPATNISVIKDGKIPIPPQRVQKRIVEILAPLDDKRKLNFDIINDLAELSAFYFRNRIETLRSQEIGERLKLEDVVEFEYGKSLPSDDREGDEYPVYGSNGKTGSHNEYLISGPGVIVGRKGVNFGTIELSLGNFWPIDTTFYVSQKKEAGMVFYYHLLETVPFQHLGSDSAVPGLNRNVALDQEVFMPPLSEARELSNELMPFHELRAELEAENSKLANIRETLLPSILAGEMSLNSS